MKLSMSLRRLLAAVMIAAAAVIGWISTRDRRSPTPVETHGVSFEGRAAGDVVASVPGSDGSPAKRSYLGIQPLSLASGDETERAQSSAGNARDPNELPAVHPWASSKRLPDAASCCTDMRLNPRGLRLAPRDVATLDGIILAANNRLDQLGEQLSAQLTSVFEAKRIAGDVHELPNGIRATHKAETFTRYVGKGTPNGLRTTYLEVLPGECPELDGLRRDITLLQSITREAVSSYIIEHGTR